MTTPPLIEHIEHDAGYHEVIFLADSRPAVDAHMAVVKTLLQDAIASDEIVTVHLVINLTQIKNVPPFAYLTKSGRKILQQFAKNRDKLHLRGVFLAKHNEMSILSLAENFIKLLPVDATIKPFEDRHAAIAWLLKDA